jgi:hypothetical protein
MAIDVGDLYRCSFTLTSPAGGNVNAGSMTLTIEVFDVRTSDAPYLVSLADIKAQTNISNTASDEELRSYLEAATGVVERHLGRAVVRRARTEQHLLRSGAALVVNWSPVISVTSLAMVDGSFTWNPATLYASSAGVITCPLGTAPYGHVTVTYVETNEIVCAAVTITGNDARSWKSARDSVYALIETVGATLRADPSLGLSAPSVAELWPGDYFQEAGPAGYQARVVFSINHKTRV